MANDYLKKQPTKNEQMIFELFRHMQGMEKSLWSTSSFVTAAAYLMKLDPKEVAKLLTADQAKLTEYSEKINKEIQAIEEKRKADEEAKAKEEGSVENK
jgi:hypothetical protein